MYKTDYLGRPDYTERWDGKLPEIPTFEPGSNGIRRKGELDYLIDYAIKEFLIDKSTDNIITFDQCTIEYIALRCTGLDGRNTSKYQVKKILKHWQELKYVTLDGAEEVFIDITEYGREVGIKQIKELDKREQKRRKKSLAYNDFRNAQIREKVKRMR